MTLTAKEFQALQGVLDSEFHDGANPINNPVWVWSANNFDNPRSFPGVVSALVKKGYVKVFNRRTKEAVIQITESGFAAHQEHVISKEGKKGIQEYNVQVAAIRNGELSYEW